MGYPAVRPSRAAIIDIPAPGVGHVTPAGLLIGYQWRENAGRVTMHGRLHFSVRGDAESCDTPCMPCFSNFQWSDMIFVVDICPLH